MPDRQIAGRGSHRTLAVGPTAGPRLMGIVNLTPDSFFDGSRFDEATAAIDHALRLLDEGVDVLDLGGESTRPGHQPVSDQVQIARLLPVLEALRPRTEVPISIDTTRAAVARATLAAGADWINDTLALGDDSGLAEVVANAGAPLVLMHRFDPPRSPADPSFAPRALVAAVARRLSEAVIKAVHAGIDRNRLLLDPGIGFGTLLADNLALHACHDPLRELNLPLLFGPSRKSFLGHLTGRDAEDRLCATAASVATLTLKGVEVLRVHDVAAMRDVVRVADAVRRAEDEDEEAPR